MMISLKKYPLLLLKIYYHTTIICFIMLLMDVEKKMKNYVGYVVFSMHIVICVALKKNLLLQKRSFPESIITRQ